MKEIYLARLIIFISIVGGFAPLVVPVLAEAQTTTSTTSTCPVLNEYLYQGRHDTGSGAQAQVRVLQQFLAQEGYNQPVTGYFGEVTRNNVMLFQRLRGIQETGTVGPITRRAIAQICNPSNPNPPLGGLQVTSPAQDQVARTGTILPIAWNYPVTPGSATMVVDLYLASSTKVGTIAINNNTIGSYNWRVPVAGEVCTLQYPNGICGYKLSGQYYVQVSAVSGNGFDQNQTPIATGKSGVFTIVQSATSTATTTAAFKDDFILVSSPLPLQVISSPLTIIGKARGSWYFEGQFPIKLYDGKGHVVAQTTAHAGGNWMTTNYVPFTATLNFTPATTTTTGVLILEKDNPSGLPQNANELDFPVLFRAFQ